MGSKKPQQLINQFSVNNAKREEKRTATNTWECTVRDIFLNNMKCKVVTKGRKGQSFVENRQMEKFVEYKKIYPT